MSTKNRTATLWVGILAVAACGVLTVQFASRLQAQALVAPSFTQAQVTAGQTTFAQSCASCHGANLDDGEFGPPLKVSNSDRPGSGAQRIELFDQNRVDATGSAWLARCADYAERLAYLMSQNLLVAADKPLASRSRAAEGDAPSRLCQAARVAA